MRLGGALINHAEKLLLALAGAVWLFGAIVPFLAIVALSLSDLDLGKGRESLQLVGLANYGRSAHDVDFQRSISRSATYAASLSLATLVTGGLLAIVIRRSRVALRTIAPVLLVPVLMPGVVLGLCWRLQLQGEFGLITYYVERFAGPVGILGEAKLALLAIACVDLWQWAPFVGFVIAMLRRSIPRDILEAAALDGAGPVRRRLTVILPWLTPHLVVIAALRFADAFRDFDKIYVLTGGGPGTATELVALYIYRVAFRRWELGYAAALTIIAFLVLAVWSGAVRAALTRTRWS